VSETSSMERARCKAAAAPRNNSAGGAAGWTALRAPESREECEMMHAYACHVCGPVNLTGETRTGINASIAHSPGAGVINRANITPYPSFPAPAPDDDDNVSVIVSDFSDYTDVSLESSVCCSNILVAFCFPLCRCHLG